MDTPEINIYAVLGERDKANEIAASADSKPLGILTLLNIVINCYCGAPFDLEATPNFARFIEEANLPWPLQSPIEWPLKTW